MKQVFFLLTAPWVIIWQKLTSRREVPVTDATGGDWLDEAIDGIAGPLCALACIIELMVVFLICKAVWGLFV